MAWRACCAGLIFVLLVVTGVSAQPSEPSEPDLEALRAEEIEETRDVQTRVDQAKRTADGALASTKEALNRGRDLLRNVANQPDRLAAVEEALADLAGAWEIVERSAGEVATAAAAAGEALGELTTASSAEALEEARNRAFEAQDRAEAVAQAAAVAEAQALAAQAEIATRAAGVRSPTDPYPGWKRIMPYGVVVGSILVLLVIGYVFTQVRQWLRRKKGGPVPRGEDADLRNTVYQIQWWFLVVLLAGVAMQFFWLMAGGLGPPNTSPETAFVLHLGISGAALILGGLLGFLFGIPRTPDPGTIDVEAGDPTWRTRVATNTSLEQVSTWLTTLLLGATLVELGSIMSGLWNLAGLLSGVVEDADTTVVTPGRIFTLSLMIFYFGAGFLGFYLFTRLYLTYALALTIRQGRFGGGAKALQEINTDLRETLKQGDALNPVYLRRLLQRAAQIEGAMQLPDHLVLRLRSWGKLYDKAQSLKEDQATIIQSAINDLHELERVSQAWSGDRDKVKAQITDLLTSDPSTLADVKPLKDEPLFQQYGVS